MRRALSAALLRAAAPLLPPAAPAAAAARLLPLRALSAAAEATAAAAARSAVADAAFARGALSPGAGRSLPPLPARLAAVAHVARGAERGVALAAAAAPAVAEPFDEEEAESSEAAAAANVHAAWPPPQQAPALVAAVGADQTVMVKAFYIGKKPFLTRRACYLRSRPDAPFRAAQSIDLGALAREYAVHPKAQHRDSVIISLAPDGGAPGVGESSSGSAYASVTGFGSVVFFGVAPAAQAAFLDAARRACTKQLAAPYADELQLRVQPSLRHWSALAADTLALRALDSNNLRVVSLVLAQSVALNHFEAKVDAMLEVFGALNREMEKVGTMPLPKRRLFQLVAENNSTITDVITKLGLLSRSDAAWAAARYAKIWEGLRADFELDDRFENLHFKCVPLRRTACAAGSYRCASLLDSSQAGPAVDAAAVPHGRAAEQEERRAGVDHHHPHLR